MFRSDSIPMILSLLSCGSAAVSQIPTVVKQQARVSAGTAAKPSIVLLRNKSGSSGLPTTLPMRASGPQPARLTQAEFSQLRGQIADLLKVPDSMVPLILIPAQNLATPGHVLNIGFGTPPPGAGFYAYHASITNGPVLQPYPQTRPIVGAMDGGLSHIRLAAPISTPGIFLMTVYVNTDIPQIACTAMAGTAQTTDFSPTILVAPQGGKLFITYECTRPNPQQIAVELEVNLTPNQRFYCYSCDFIRIK